MLRTLRFAACFYLLAATGVAFAGPVTLRARVEANGPAVTLGDVFESEAKLSYDEYLKTLGLPSSGALRVSLGLASNFADVHRFVELARSFLDRFPESVPLQPRSHC